MSTDFDATMTTVCVITEVIADPAIVVDASGDVVHANDAARALLPSVVDGPFGIPLPHRDAVEVELRTARGMRPFEMRTRLLPDASGDRWFVAFRAVPLGTLRQRAVAAGASSAAVHEVADLVDDVLDLVPHLVVDTEIPPGTRVYGDRLQTLEILASLLDNAHVHGAGPVRVSARGEASWVEITVADSGTGIPADQREQAFEFGWSGPGIERFGMGLAVARKFAAANDGNVWIDEVEVGTSVTARLPARRPGMRPGEDARS